MWWVDISVSEDHAASSFRVQACGDRVRVTLQLSVSQSVFVLSPSRTHDQILIAVKTVVVLFVMEHLPCQEDRSVL